MSMAETNMAANNMDDTTNPKLVLTPLMCRADDGGCKFNRLDVGDKKGPSLQCLWCMEWYHIECVNVKKEHQHCSFSCLNCRVLPDQMRKVPGQITELQKEV